MTAPGKGPVPPAADRPDTVVDVVERLMGEFEDRLNLRQISRVVLGCRADLAGCPPGALPELVERLAHQRLLDAVPRTGALSHRTGALAR